MDNGRTHRHILVEDGGPAQVQPPERAQPPRVRGQGGQRVARRPQIIWLERAIALEAAEPEEEDERAAVRGLGVAIEDEAGQLLSSSVVLGGGSSATRMRSSDGVGACFFGGGELTLRSASSTTEEPSR